MARWPQVILLNGTSSSGKTTLAEALQASLVVPYLYFSFDTLIFASPKRYWQDAATPQQNKKNPYLDEGVRMIEIQKEGEPKKIQAEFGPVFQSIISSMPFVVAELVKHGNRVIFDYIYHDEEMFDQCNDALAPYDVLTVGVYCPLALAEQRERERKDRVLGRARGLYDVVHSFGDYDLIIDTSELSVEQAVEKIKRYLEI